MFTTILFAQSVIETSERTVVLGVLTEYAQHMIHMGVAAGRTRALISQMCSLAALTSSQREELLSLIVNIGVWRQSTAVVVCLIRACVQSV